MKTTNSLSYSNLKTRNEQAYNCKTCKPCIAAQCAATYSLMQNPCDTDTSPLLLCHPRAPPAVMPGLHKCDALRLRYAKTSFCISFASFASDRAPPIPTITISLRHPRPFGPACFGFAQHKQGQAPARFPPRHPREGEDPLSSVKPAL